MYTHQGIHHGHLPLPPPLCMPLLAMGPRPQQPLPLHFPLVFPTATQVGAALQGMPLHPPMPHLHLHTHPLHSMQACPPLCPPTRGVLSGSPQQGPRHMLQHHNMGPQLLHHSSRHMVGGLPTQERQQCRRGALLPTTLQTWAPRFAQRCLVVPQVLQVAIPLHDDCMCV